MQNITEIVQLVLLISSFIVMGIGVYNDIKHRCYPNKVLISIILLGIMYSIFAGHILESLVGFIVVNLLGILCHKFRFIAPGDMKYLSTLFLFINIRNYRLCLILIVYMFLFMILMSIYYYYKTKKNCAQDLKKQFFSYKALFCYRINMFGKKEYKDKETMLKESFPFTLPFYLAYIFTIITSIFVNL